LYTVGGRKYVCEAPKYINGVLRTFEYKMINYLCQGSAADIMKEAMVRYFENKRRQGRPMFVVHDELVVSVKASHATSEDALISDCMTSALRSCLDVPLLVESAIGRNYAEV
jgi:DNA polymerase I-like protein with 3'-5' exonuclease and polymerase domains